MACTYGPRTSSSQAPAAGFSRCPCRCCRWRAGCRCIFVYEHGSRAELVAGYHALAPDCERQMMRGSTMQVASVSRLHTQLSLWTSQICVLPLAARDARILGLSGLLSSCCTGPATPARDPDLTTISAWNLCWPTGAHGQELILQLSSSALPWIACSKQMSAWLAMYSAGSQQHTSAVCDVHKVHAMITRAGELGKVSYLAFGPQPAPVQC